MTQINHEFETEFLKSINSLVDNEKIKELFCIIPTLSIDVYNRTVSYFSNTKYEEFMEQGNGIPRNFYSIIENELKNNTFVAVIKKYEKELKLICDTLSMDFMDIVNLIKFIKLNLNKPVTKEIADASQKLKNIIRKFTSIYKENYIKQVNKERIELLKQSLIIVERKNSKLGAPEYIDMIMRNKIVKEIFTRYIFDNFYIEVDDRTLFKLLNAIFMDNSVLEIADILGINKPVDYNDSLMYKEYKRLCLNYQNIINSRYKDMSHDDLLKIVSYINTKAKCKASNTLLPTPYTDAFKVLFDNTDSSMIEDIIVLMSICNATLEINEQNHLYFKSNVKGNEVARRNYEKDIKKIKNFISFFYLRFKKVNKVLLDEDESTEEICSTYIDSSKWLSVDKFKRLLESINISKINELDDNELLQLQVLLNEKGLLWAYYSDNFDVSIISKIINNFGAIYNCCKNEDINIQNIQDIVRKANLYDYATDLSIALLGNDVVAKVINYNQFAGTTVTPEMINDRVLKATDLAYRAELADTSSLSYKVLTELNGYKLTRYKNNDPYIFTSGIDTNTCFFVSVNENDFFFYSLLNKNGFVIKITDPDGRFVARATCFRRNNVLMINGIRTVSNKVVPENRNDLEMFNTIVELITTMSKKIIESTSNDECPIDYVVCNKAGILENTYFDNRFEEINTGIIREPINIYEDDWQEFIHMYDNQPKQLLQEVPSNGSTSFTTDFGGHYPAVLIASRNHMFLDRPSNISLKDQSDTYERPRFEVEEYISSEINKNIIDRLNRIRALSCFYGDSQEEIDSKKEAFRLIKDGCNIKNLILGEDWYIAINFDNTVDVVIGNIKSKKCLFELNCYLYKIQRNNSSRIIDKDVIKLLLDIND